MGLCHWIITWSLVPFVDWIFHNDIGCLQLKSQGLCLTSFLLLSFAFPCPPRQMAQQQLSHACFTHHTHAAYLLAQGNKTSPSNSWATPPVTDSHSVSPHPRLPDSPEDLLEELPHDRAEEETLSNAKVRSLVFVWDGYVALFIYFMFNCIHQWKSGLLMVYTVSVMGRVPLTDL